MKRPSKLETAAKLISTRPGITRCAVMVISGASYEQVDKLFRESGKDRIPELTK